MELALLAAAGPWDYSHHGDDWYGRCMLDVIPQSPINFAAVHAHMPSLGKVAYSYEPVAKPFELFNNGHAIFADLGGRSVGGISLDDVWYSLMNVAFHAPGEHTFEGHRHGGELHLTHQKWNSPDLLVVAIPVRAPAVLPAGAADTFLQRAPAQGGHGRASEVGFNRMVEMFMRVALPKVHGSVVVAASDVDTLDIDQWFEGQFYEYPGTTTVPPCVDATWLVRRAPLDVSSSQLSNLTQALLELSQGQGNYRAVQKTGDRAIRVRDGVRQRPIPGFPPQRPFPHGRFAGSREYRALRTAKDALTVAKLTGEYVDDLDARLVASADAHAAAMAGPAVGPPLPNATGAPASADAIRQMVRSAMHGAADRLEAEAHVVEQPAL